MMEKLPHELLLHILSFLPLSPSCALLLVSHEWHELCLDGRFSCLILALRLIKWVDRHWSELFKRVFKAHIQHCSVFNADIVSRKSSTQCADPSHHSGSNLY